MVDIRAKKAILLAFKVFEIHPKGVTASAEDAGFTVTGIQAMGAHYATTLDHWTDALHEHRDRAIESPAPVSTTPTSGT
ncbi:class I SAM-dependent methyltransferase [Nocardia xishanensis]